MLKRPPRPDLSRLESFMPWLALALLGALTYALFFQVPYAGIYFSSQGILTRVYVTAPADQALQVGDQFLKVLPLTWTAFKHDLRQPLFAGIKPGEVVSIVIERNSK